MVNLLRRNEEWAKNVKCANGCLACQTTRRQCVLATLPCVVGKQFGLVCMKRVMLVLTGGLSLSACNTPSDLPGDFAVEAVDIKKLNGLLDVSVEISTTANLVTELKKLGPVTYGYLSCPLDEKAIFDPKVDAGKALHAPVNERWLVKDSGLPTASGQKYRYQLTGRFDHGDNTHGGKGLAYDEIAYMLKKQRFLQCKIIILRHFRSPYFSNAAFLKTDDLIAELENINK